MSPFLYAYLLSKRFPYQEKRFFQVCDLMEGHVFLWEVKEQRHGLECKPHLYLR